MDKYWYLIFHAIILFYFISFSYCDTRIHGKIWNNLNQFNMQMNTMNYIMFCRKIKDIKFQHTIKYHTQWRYRTRLKFAHTRERQSVTSKLFLQKLYSWDHDISSNTFFLIIMHKISHNVLEFLKFSFFFLGSYDS